MAKNLCRTIFIVLTVFLTQVATAELFQNAYITFKKPNNWKCVLEGAEWVCFSRLEDNKKKKRSATIILTAKEKGPFDTINSYTSYLKTANPLPSKTGKPLPAKAYNVTQKMIQDHMWVDALHYGSQIPKYYTRYLATVKGQLAILITLSAHKDQYSKYSKDFVEVVKSLKIVSTGITNKKAPGIQSAGSGSILGSGIEPGELTEDALPSEPSGGNKNDITSLLLGLALVLGAGGFYFFKKKRA